MKLFISVTCVLVAINAVVGQQFSSGGSGGTGGGGGSCSKSSSTFKRETGRFLNCLQSKIESEIHRYEYGEAGQALNDQTADIKDAFSGSSCNIPSEVFSPTRANLKSFLKSIGFDSTIYNDFVDAVSDVLWTAVKNEPFTICFLGFIREKFLIYMRDYTGAAIPVNPSEGLNNLPTFTNGQKQINWDKAELSVNQILIAALAAHECGRSGKSVLRKLNADVYEDACYCKTKRYCSCLDTATDTCPAVNDAVNNILKHPEQVMTVDQVGAQALHCFQNFGGNGELAAKGLKLQQVFKSLNKSQTDKMFEILEALVSGFFSSDFCAATCTADRSEC